MPLPKIQGSKNFLSVKQRAGELTNQWMKKNRSLVLRQTPVWAQSLTSLAIALGSLLVVGGIFFRIDEVVTVQGQLKSIGGTIELESPIGGQVAEIFFEDGETVKKGQLLVRFDTREAAERKETLTRLISLENKQLESQLQTFNSHKSSIQSRSNVIKKKLETMRNITSEMQTLVEQGGFQRIQYLQQLDSLYELESRSADLDEQLNRLQLQEMQTSLQSAKSIDRMKNELTSVELKLQYQTVHAPASGTIFDPEASLNGVLSAGERVLSIVPQSGLFAEVFVPNKDIGFVKIGQKGKVRVDAFPFTRYGELNGTVTSVAADALSPDETSNIYRFPIKLELDKPYLLSDDAIIPLKPGMSITTNLKLRDKRVISLISDLLVDQTDSVKSIRQQ